MIMWEEWDDTINDILLVTTDLEKVKECGLGRRVYIVDPKSGLGGDDFAFINLSKWNLKSQFDCFERWNGKYPDIIASLKELFKDELERQQIRDEERQAIKERDTREKELKQLAELKAKYEGVAE